MRNLSFLFPAEYTIENLFSLAIIQKTSSTKIIMQLQNQQVNTGHIPFIVDLLEKHLPTVLLTKCYNEEQLPFALEVKCTEIGHLFEHILLEYLCQLKIAKGYQRAVFSGRTQWNWVRDPWGKFHIHLSCGKKDADILPPAVEKTISLMKILLNTEQTLLFPAPVPAFQNGLKNGERSRKKV